MPGGICAFTVWKHLPWIDILSKAIKEEYPISKRPMPFPSHEDALLSLTRWNPWHDTEWIRKKVEQAGFLGCPKTQEKKPANSNEVDKDEKKNEKADIKENKKEDWSMYEFQSGEGRPNSSRKSSKTITPRTASSVLSASPSSMSDFSPSSSSSPTTSNAASASTGSLVIEEMTSTHRYTKHEFMSNFGTSVLDHLICASWGKESISKEATRKELREALLRYLHRICPDQLDEIELDLKAIVVVIKKSEGSNVPSEM